MTITMTDAFNFKDFYDAHKDMAMPTITSYNLARIARCIAPEIKFYTDNLSACLDEYGERDDNGELITDEQGGIRLQAKYIDMAVRKLNELCDLTFDCPYTLTLEQLDGLSLTPNEIANLIPFLE